MPADCSVLCTPTILPNIAYRGINIPLLCSYRGGPQGLSTTYEQAHVVLDLCPWHHYITTHFPKRKHIIIKCAHLYSKKPVPPSESTGRLTLCHGICHFVFKQHLCMILFFDLNVCEQLSTRFCKYKHICIVFARYEFLRSDRIRCQKAVAFLILRTAHGSVSCLWVIILAIRIVAVTIRAVTGKQLSERIIMLFLFKCS